MASASQDTHDRLILAWLRFRERIARIQERIRIEHARQQQK